MNGQYEVLNPWAEADPIPLRGISPRVKNLDGRAIGLLCDTFKATSKPMLTVIERKLKERYPTSKFSWFEFDDNIVVTETKEKASFEKWVKGVDTAVAAVGD